MSIAVCYEVRDNIYQEQSGYLHSPKFSDAQLNIIGDVPYQSRGECINLTADDNGTQVTNHLSSIQIEVSEYDQKFRSLGSPISTYK
mmetsp:Transcript_34628/g.83735  ORF Transcript_34628/g.83735 Transcript_34628/m.83735 type:complete len:87 (-) Transcript_34628:290-550(-)